MKKPINLSIDREKSAKGFLKTLATSDDPIYIFDSLDDTMEVLIEAASECAPEESGDYIAMIYYLNGAINVLKYIASNDVLKEEDQL